MRKIFLAIAIALIVSSCAKQTSEEKEQAQTPIMLSSSFSAPDTTTAISSTATSSIETKPQANHATRVTATAFEAGDQLGLFVVKAGQGVQSADNLVDNARMVVAADGVIKGDPTAVYYPESSVSIYSYYPYQSGDATADALGVQVGIRTDQTDFSSAKLSDLCFGSLLNTDPSKSAKPISFSHKFSQLRVEVSTYTGCPAVKQVRLLGIKDSALLNIETGAVTLKNHVAEVLPNKRAENSYLAVIPVQTLTGACVAIDLADGKTFVFNAVSPIDLTQSATNSLNLLINDKGVVTLKGDPSISPWTGISDSGVVNSAVENDISLYWLSPHADYATADKVTLTITDPLGVVREVDLVPTVDPKSSSEYAIYNLNLTLAGTTYPLTVNGLKVYKGSEILRESPQAALISSTIYKIGSHIMGLNFAIEISPSGDWLNVSGYGESKTITITTTGGVDWTASASGTGLSVSPTSGKSGQTATITWAAHFGQPAPPLRLGFVMFSSIPEGAIATINTSQSGVIAPPNTVYINGIWWAKGNLVANGTNSCRIGAPTDGGLYFQFGSLIGWKGGTTGDGTGRPTKTGMYVGTKFQSVNEYKVAPVSFTRISSIGTVWPSQTINLYYFGLTSYADSANIHDYPGVLNGSLASDGVGDPCRYYLGGSWRLPTPVEYQALHDAAKTITYPGKWSSDPPSTTSYLVLTFNSGEELRFPAAGYRTTSVGQIGSYSYYWSSSVNGNSGCHVLFFGDSSVYPQNHHSRYYGFSVRCVSN